MSTLQDKLSAFLDGELPADEATAIEKALESDPALQAELDSLMAADALAQDQFAAVAAEPVPLALAAAIRNAPQADQAQMQDGIPSPAKPRGIAGWMVAAAAALMLVIGGVGGYITGQSNAPQRVASTPAWLVDIADYHAVYARQERHLVEVPADEVDHIQTWLTATLGVDVAVPDLSGLGLDFQGARLLVAAGKPVAQLMYRDGEGRVVALCQIHTTTPRDGIAQQTIGAFDMVSWGGSEANFVVVGDEGNTNLTAIAQAVAQQV